MADPRKLVDKTDIPIALQTASQMISMKPVEVWELVEEEMVEKSPEQVEMVKGMIKSLLKSQALAHHHVTDVADHLTALADVVSVPALLQVMNGTVRPVVAVEFMK